MMRVDESSQNTPICSVFKACGACQMLDMPYEEQIVWKEAYVEELFAELCDSQTQLLPLKGMQNPYYYRNKIISPFSFAKKRSKSTKPAEVLYGMYAQGSHRIIDSSSCVVENPLGLKIKQEIVRLIKRYKISLYDEDKHEGFLRHVQIRIGHNSGEVLVTLVTNAQDFVGARNFCRELVRKVPEITSIVQNVNTRKTNVILGEKERVLYGPGFILDKLCNASFRISSKSFYQVSAGQTEVLYEAALRFADLKGTERVLDAYCGTGTIGIVAARGLPDNPSACAAELVGIEARASAVEDARKNALHNGVEHAHFIVGDAGAFMEECARNAQHFDVVFMDPARAGADERFLDALALMAPKRIVYISCNPSTQKRDIAYLQNKAYCLRTLQAVDMFPHTKHIETVALLVHKSCSGG